MKSFALLFSAVLLLTGVSTGEPSNPPPATPPETPKPIEQPASDQPVKPAVRPPTNYTIFVPSWLNRCNTDRDSKVAKDEFANCFIKHVTDLDKDKDGAMSKKEYEDGMDASKKKFLDAAEKTFQKHDKNKDGELEFAETELKKEDDFKSLDLNGDGGVDHDEYHQISERRFPQWAEQNLHWLPFAWDGVDRNHDDKITAEEMKKSAEISFDLRDANKDGLINGSDAELQAQKKGSTEIPPLKPAPGNPPGPPPVKP
ncbi:MAG: hypothetical protein ACREJQ_04730 [bacterium]